jgi:hypothetical protein
MARFRDEAINESEYVFEGIIIKKSAYHRNNNTLASDIVKVTKVFRGNLMIGTVEIVTYANMVAMEYGKERETLLAADLRKHHNDTLGIFFCRLAKEFPYDKRYNIDVTVNKPVLTDYHNKEMTSTTGDRIISTHYGYDGIPFLKQGRIQTKAELYQILRKFPNLKIPDVAEPEPVDSEHIYLPKPTNGSTLKLYLDSLHNARNNEDFKKTKKDCVK